MKLYGWYELNEAAFGLQCEIRDSAEFSDSDFSSDGELRSTHPEIPSDEGKWFRTFAAAKKGMRTQLQAEIHWRKLALQDLAKTKAKSVR